MSSADEADSMNIEVTSLGFPTSHQGACDVQWHANSLPHASTFDMVSIRNSDKKDSPIYAHTFSSTLQDSSLVKETRYPTLLSCLEQSPCISVDCSGMSQEGYRMKSHTEGLRCTCSEYLSRSAKRETLDRRSPSGVMEESNPILSIISPSHEQQERVNDETPAFLRSCQLDAHLDGVPIVSTPSSRESKEAVIHATQKDNRFDSMIPLIKDGIKCQTPALEYTGNHHSSNQARKSNRTDCKKASAFVSASERVSRIQNNFNEQPRNNFSTPKWQKVLYEKQPFEDNYVDPLQFLEDLRQNEHLKTYEYTEVVKNTFAITQQISIVILFVCAFSMLLDQTMNHYTILYMDFSVFFATFVVYLELQGVKSSRTNTQDFTNIRLSQIAPASGSSCGNIYIKTCGRRCNTEINCSGFTSDSTCNARKQHCRGKVKFGLPPSTSQIDNPNLRKAKEISHPRLQKVESVFDFFRKTIGLGTLLVLLTPILSTLTASYSNDTIVALSIFMMSLHILTANYSYLNAYTTDFSPNLSVNAASFGVIMMASRIPNPLDSGALIAFGSFCFSLSPMVRHFVKYTSFTAHVALTFVLFGIVTGCLLTIPILLILYVTCILMISFVIPWWFVSLHSSMKDQINGPWDEAKPTNSAAAAEWANAGLLT